MAIKTSSSLFFNNKTCVNEQHTTNCQPPIKTIAWFGQMTRDVNLNMDEIDVVLSELNNFIDQREFDKSEALAEIQLALAFQEILQSKKEELLSLKSYRR